MSPLTKSKPEHPYQYTGFGFEFADLDGDGDQDLVLANNDFDTPHSEVGIFWYENLVSEIPSTGLDHYPE
ncbi:MAG: hypothetical protein ACP5RH_05245 [Leptodesmis sp.]|uniref:hypothetical protein n=1 Tax=Leptodesmis sp. TaxID=3100501 RepID=UPI003D0F61B8